MSSLKSFLKRLRALPAGDLRQVSVGGVRLSGRADDKAFTKLAAWTPDWKSDLIGRALAAREGAFLDVGANVGQTLVDFAQTGRRSGYVGFEPNPRCVDHLQRLMRANDLDYLLVPAGLSDANRAQRLYSVSGTTVDGSATLVADLRPARTLQAEVIACLRLDDIYQDLLGDTPVALVKVDVEGAELYTFRGMRAFLADRRPWVICEVLGRAPEADHDAYQARNAELAGILREAGYGMLRMLKPLGDKVVGCEPVDAFPDVVWSRETENDYDYLFAPAAEMEAAARLLQR